MKGSGVKIRPTAMESSLMPTMQCIQETGSMILSTDMVKSSGIMEQHDIRANSLKARRMAKGGLTGKTEAIMMGNSSTDSSKGSELITLQILTRLIKASLECLTWKVEV